MKSAATVEVRRTRRPETSPLIETTLLRSEFRTRRETWIDPPPMME
jgi:hypothetical protein